MFVKGGFDPVRAFWNKVDIKTESECWNWKGSTFKTGYGKVCRNYKYLGAHRIAFELTYYCPVLQVLHKCDNRLCCNPKHLFEGTLETNMLDKTAKSRQCKGSQFRSAKITEDQALQIRNSTLTQHELARIYNIDQSTISRIKTNKRWKHV